MEMGEDHHWFEHVESTTGPLLEHVVPNYVLRKSVDRSTTALHQLNCKQCSHLGSCVRRRIVVQMVADRKAQEICYGRQD